MRALAVAFSGNGTFLVTEDQTGNPPGQGAPERVNLRDARTGDLLWSRPLPDRSSVWNGGEIGVVYVTNDGSTVVVGNPDGGFVYFLKGRVVPAATP